MKTNLLSYVALITVITVFMFSCKKKEIAPETTTSDPTNNTAGPIASQQTILASFGGTIVDESNLPVGNAVVTLGNQSMTTNSFGNFYFTSIAVDATRAYIKVEKAGYFHGSRAINPQAGEIHNVKIKLIPKVAIGSFNSVTGSTVSTSGVSLVFEPGEISWQGGVIYNGTVNVYASYLDPTAADLSEIMLGDLQAKDANNNVVFLETYGMVVVELEGPNGEELNVASGQTVELKMPVTSVQLGNAPSSIPLWYFNETYGNWVEEGSATLQGNEYVGHVSHFSYWNCDDPYSPVDWSIKIECGGDPMENIPVRMKNANTDIIYGISYTNTSGNITEPIPAGIDLIMEVLDPCGDVLYSQNIGVVNSPIDLGTISLCNTPTPPSSHFLATIVDCNNQPISNGMVNITIGNSIIPYFTDANGTIDAMILHCGQATIDVMAYNMVNTMQSPTSSLPIGASINAGTIVVCSQIDEYINFTFDGVQSLIVEGNDQVSSYVSTNSPGDVMIYASGGSGIMHRAVQLIFQGDDVGVYSNTTGFGPGQPLAPTSIVAPTNYPLDPGEISIIVTNYANVAGEYFEGTFSGTFEDDQGVTHTVSGTFRNIRN